MKLDELKQYDGKDGRPAYIVYKGDIYDVTGSKLWKNGSHVNRHFAGEDLSHQMSVAPHSDEVMSRFKKVGTLEIEKQSVEIDRMEKLRDFYRKFHPHPVQIETVASHHRSIRPPADRAIRSLFSAARLRSRSKELRFPAMLSTQDLAIFLSHLPFPASAPRR